MKTVCPLQCRLRHSAASDNPPGDETADRDHVEWGGFAANLDWAFSGKQRDKVYMQHLKRSKRGAHLWRPLHDRTGLCACEIAAKAASLDPDLVNDYVTSSRR